MPRKRCVGKECDTSFRDRVVSIELDTLRRAEEVVAVIAASDRTEAIRGALNGGLIKSLVIDQKGAAALLKSASWQLLLQHQDVAL